MTVRPTLLVVENGSIDTMRCRRCGWSTLVVREATIEVDGPADDDPPDDHELLPLREVIAAHIAHVLDRCDGNKRRAAEILGIDPSTLHRRLRERRDR